jgi:hypothetical protein
MNEIPAAFSVLTSMITPAVLISASGALVLSTSFRLGRVIDRVRKLSTNFEELAHETSHVELREERHALIFDQLDKLTSRARLLQRAMTTLYVALGVFVATSVAIGMVGLAERYGWIPVVMTWIGMGSLLYASVLLVVEARLALAGLHAEMDFLWKLGQRHAPAEYRKSRSNTHIRGTEG